MELEELKKFNESDLQKCKALQSIIKKAKLEITGEAAIGVASLFSWLNNDLDKKIQDTLHQQKLDGAPEIIEGDNE